VIDRKRNLDEVAGNLKTKDSGRFWREIRRARAEHIKLIILVEHGGQIHNIRDVANWSSKYSWITGRQVMEEMYRTHMAYGVEWLFCDKRSTGRKIVELLTEGRGNEC
jgi:thioredoxin reductase